MSEPGSLSFCEGSWFVAITVQAELLISGQGDAVSTLSGGAAPVVTLSAEAGAVALRDLTLADGRAP